MRFATKKTVLVAIAAGASVAAACTAFTDDTDEDGASVSIPDSALIGFEKCAASNELRIIMDDLIAHGRAIAKENGIWAYAVNGRFLGMEIRRLELGVCNASGERGCGWAVYTGLGIDLPEESARRQMKEKTGIDFTEELRDDEANTTMRPLLSAGPNGSGSLLLCDPGDL